jgi:hypothetical protein
MIRAIQINYHNDPKASPSAKRHLQTLVRRGAYPPNPILNLRGS